MTWISIRLLFIRDVFLNHGSNTTDDHGLHHGDGVKSIDGVNLAGVDGDDVNRVDLRVDNNGGGNNNGLRTNNHRGRNNDGFGDDGIDNDNWLGLDGLRFVGDGSRRRCRSGSLEIIHVDL